MKCIETEKLHIKTWCNNPEDSAIKQAKNLAQLPFAYHHIALMPDTHQGYGMPIGGVLATNNTIVPNAVGVDIGCGMLACQTTITEITRDEIKNVMGIIRETIPVGFNHRDKPLEIIAPPDNTPIALREYENARRQVGTLGGGNHFIEIQQGNDGYIWFMIHSGSRNIGKKVCDYYNGTAKEQNRRWHSSIPEKWDLAFLPEDSDEGQQYIAEMRYCQHFAQINRETMSSYITEAFKEVFETDNVANVVYNVHHNYAAKEHHFGKNVWVHRKGATSAQEGEIGIIPGSQGTKSYIITGLGNPDSFRSCSHGAGRRMGRKEAQRTLSLAKEIQRMEEKGIVHGIRTVTDLDEAAGAYKDIDVVMTEQSDLVAIMVELTPLGVIKG